MPNQNEITISDADASAIIQQQTLSSVCVCELFAVDISWIGIKRMEKMALKYRWNEQQRNKEVFIQLLTLIADYSYRQFYTRSKKLSKKSIEVRCWLNNSVEKRKTTHKSLTF